MAVGSFYHYFGSKDGTLLHGLVAEDEAVDVLLANSDGETHVERIRRLFLNRVFMGTVNITLDLSVAFSIAELRHGLPDAFAEPRRAYLALREEIQAAQSAGTLTPDVDAGTIAEGLLLAAAGLIHAWQLAGGAFPVMERAAVYADTQLRLLKK
ncbi:MAG TPA: TetR/AcrR family transcriptional regulator [Actinomycetaceae bacterium]|nr:TetR/AcrR family transcriptional regulator [Actinomycetaceae bacterium]